MLPWEVEPRAYQSELAAALPIGLRMPQTYDVIELDESSAAIWLEDIDIDDITWTAVHFRRAAELLGRFAVSPAVRAAVAPLGPLDRSAYRPGVCRRPGGRDGHSRAPG